MDEIQETAENVISFAAKRNMTEPKTDDDLYSIIESTDLVLDVIEQEFEAGVFIGMKDNKFQLSATIEDSTEILQVLLSAVASLYESERT